MADVKNLVDCLSKLDWSWTVAWWAEQVNHLGLKEQSATNRRKTFVDSDGVVWDLYLTGDNISFLEINVEVSADPESLSDSEYEDQVDEYFQKFESAVREVQSVLGKPAFSDGAGAKGFPEDQDATWLALWMLRGARLMVQQKHEARDLPFRLCLVVTQ